VTALINKKTSLFHSPGGYVFRPNFTRAAQIALRDFRESRLGRVNLDLDLLKHCADTSVHSHSMKNLVE